MSFIKDKHNTLFKEKLDVLLTDKGESVTFYIKNPQKAICTWCLHDYFTDRSSGLPATDCTGTQDIVIAQGYDLTPYWVGQWITSAGARNQDILVSFGFDMTPYWLGQWIDISRSSLRIWSKHPNYINDFICPECQGSSYTNKYTTLVLDNIIVMDIREEEGIITKLGHKMKGFKILYGKLSEVLNDVANINSSTLFESCVRIKIRNDYYKLFYLKKLGLKDLYLYEAMIVRTDAIF